MFIKLAAIICAVLLSLTRGNRSYCDSHQNSSLAHGLMHIQVLLVTAAVTRSPDVACRVRLAFDYCHTTRIVDLTVLQALLLF